MMELQVHLSLTHDPCFKLSQEKMGGGNEETKEIRGYLKGNMGSKKNFVCFLKGNILELKCIL